MDTSQLADSAARKLAERNAAQTWQAKAWRYCSAAWNGTPSAIRATLLFIATCIALGFLSVMTFWELSNAGAGYSLIFAGWGSSLAFWGGVSIAGFYMWSHRQHKEQDREKEELEAQEAKALEASNLVLANDLKGRIKKAKQRSQRWWISTLLCVMVTGFGVFSNLVSHASMDTAHAVEVSEDRQQARQNKARLVRELGVMPKPEGVEFTRETLAAYEAEATGWKMENLAPDGACKGDLKKRQRELCNLASDIRAELAEADEMQAALNAKQVEIDNAQKAIDALQPVAGAAHYQAMAKLVMSLPGVPSDWDEQGIAKTIQVWGVLFLAFAGLYVCAIGWDSLGEAYEGRGKKKLPAPMVQKG